MNNSETLVQVVKRLDKLRDRIVFVGGVVRELLITDTAPPPERPTDDVDGIVSIASLGDYYKLAGELRSLGFQEDKSDGAPICRWLVAGIRVDIMPDDEKILSFKSRWYTDAVQHAVLTTLGGEPLKHVNATYFCATKLDAFADRGNGDYYHHDLEDLVAVVDGRAELLDEVRDAAQDVRRYIGAQIAGLLSLDAFVEALPGHLPGDQASQARLPLLAGRLRELAALAD